jgi:hypothetical protein
MSESAERGKTVEQLKSKVRACIVCELPQGGFRSADSRTPIPAPWLFLSQSALAAISHQLAKLEKLCRALQAQRTELSNKLEQSNEAS